MIQEAACSDFRLLLNKVKSTEKMKMGTPVTNSVLKNIENLLKIDDVEKKDTLETFAQNLEIKASNAKYFLYVCM